MIDCGPARASATDNITISSSNYSSLPDPQKAVRDWRFGQVRVESVDMVSSRPDPRRGESSAEIAHANKGINAGLATGGSVGRVTKARYEALEGKNTEMGWGIVHLYRDSEETPGLGSAGAEMTTEVYSSASAEGTAIASGSGDRLGAQDTGKGDEDCTTLCIPAVPSYLTPSDFLGWVGEKTREEVSHFRMVMTGRMNRYLVLMKFRDGGSARRWRAEWDGKVFNSMEVRLAIISSAVLPNTYEVELTCHCSQKPVT